MENKPSLNGIRVEGLCKSFGDKKVLNDLSFFFEYGSTAVIRGSSGSGKTTLLNLIGALERPDSGRLVFDGTDYSTFMRSPRAAADFRNRRIGFIFQNYQLLPEFTIYENVLIPAKLAGANMKNAQKLALELLDELGLADRIHHRGSELSGGEQQRAAVARALINDPELILADEPTGNLDSATGEKLLALFRKLSSDHTIIMITHNEALTGYADKVLHLCDGVLS